MRWVGVIILAAGVASAASCIDQGHSCDDMYLTCDQTRVTLQSPSDAWASGTYALAIVADGVPEQCTMQIPDPPAAAQGTCSATGTTLGLAPICTPPPVVCDAGVCTGSVSSADCTPGHFTMALTIGTPMGSFLDAQPHVVGQLGLNLSMGGNTLVGETVEPTVTTTGSAACGFCTNASATVSISGGWSNVASGELMRFQIRPAPTGWSPFSGVIRVRIPR
jgi:hypothetical protein